ncbi:hypothetical protein GG344DRAFT_79487 [Lentinula edodes]|nr:hypothetical protein GG344DRAFT_79487 [Lentinula edodes]
MTCVAVAASPLLTSHNSQAVERRGPELAARHGFEVELILGIIGEGTKSEHWVLVFGETYIHAIVDPSVDPGHLSVQGGLESWNPHDFHPVAKEIHLGNAVFRDEHEQWEVIKNMLYTKDPLKLVVPRLAEGTTQVLQMPIPVKEKGGNCMDFLKRAVEYMAEGHGLDGNAEAKRKFLEAFNARYHDVAKVAFNFTAKEGINTSSLSSQPPITLHFEKHLALCTWSCSHQLWKITVDEETLGFIQPFTIFIAGLRNPLNDSKYVIPKYDLALVRFTVHVDELAAAFANNLCIGLAHGDKPLHGKKGFVNKKLKETVTPNVQDWNLYDSFRVTKVPVGQARFNH